MAQSVLYTSLLKYITTSYSYLPKLEGTSHNLLMGFAGLQEYLVRQGEECVQWMSGYLAAGVTDGGDRCVGGGAAVYTVADSAGECGLTKVDAAESTYK
jgi:hypothetical protein